MSINCPQIVFVDSQLLDLPTLLAGLPQDLHVHLLDPAQDGLKQIAAVLEGQSGISALHLITHGAPGALHFGERRITSADFSAYESELHAISAALVEDGELLIYGCEVAAGREGKAFIEALTAMTGLKAAAATHKVGAAESGGNWTLDVMPIFTTSAIHVPAWQGLLAVSTTKTGYIVHRVAGSDYNYVNGAVLTSDGKVVFTGDAYGAGYARIGAYVVRLNSDGLKDTGFDTDGQLIDATHANFWGAISYGTGYVVFGADQKLTHLNADGSIYDTWGTNGIANVTNNSRVEAAAKDANGNIYFYSGYAIKKLDSTGTLDTTWGSSGIAVSTVNDASIIVQGDGSVLIIGLRDDGSGTVGAADRYNQNWVVEKFTSAGVLDADFGTAGKAVIDLSMGSTQYAPDFVVDADGNLLITGQVQSDNGQFDFQVVRLNADGTPDATFGGDGVISYSPYSVYAGSGVYIPETTTNESFSSVAVQADGQIILAGADANGSLVVSRMNPDGTLDKNFGSSGNAFAQMGGELAGPAYAPKVLIQSDGKIVVLAGVGYNNYAKELAYAVRFNTDGTLDTTYGESETTTSFTLSISDTQTWLRPDPDTYTGTGDPEYGNFNVAMPGNTEYNYAHVKFTPTVTGKYDLKIASTTLNDTMFFVYNNDFSVDPDTSAVTGTLLIGDDDSANDFGFAATDLDDDGLPTGQAFRSGLNDLSLTGGTEYVFVVSSYDAADAGDIEFQLSGPAGVTLGEGSFPGTPPTLTSVSVLSGTEDTTNTITFDNLQTAGDEADADVDGTVDAFIVKSVTSGTLKIGTSANTATDWHATTNATIDGTHHAYWTPAAHANSTLASGALEAFKLVAVDNNGAQSTTPVVVTINVAAVPDQPYLQHAGVLYSTNNSLSFMKTDGTTTFISSSSGSVSPPVPVKDGYLVNAANIPKVLKADGTLVDIATSGQNPLYSSVQYILPYGDSKAVMLVNVPDGSGNPVQQLVLTDGTAANTQNLTKFTTNLNLRKPVVSGDKVFFLATTTAEGEELWVADLSNPGTPTEVSPVSGVYWSGSSYYKRDAQIDTNSITAFNDGVVFTARDVPVGRVSTDDGTELPAIPAALYFSDGTTITQLSTGVYNGSSAVNLGSKVIFGGQVNSNTYGTWVTDGTAQGTVRLQFDSAALEAPFQILGIGSGAALIVGNSTRDIYLYSSQDPDNAVMKAFEIPTGYTGTGIYGLLGDGTVVLSFLNNSTSKYGLWKLVSGEAQPILIKDGFSSLSASNDVQLIDGKIWFVAGATTWVTDGSAEGTMQVSSSAKSLNGFYYPWAQVATDNSVKGNAFTTIGDSETADTITGNTVAQLVAANMIADPDVVSAPEAIAVTAASAGTGSGNWQYKIGNGVWTNFDFSANSGKALLLDATDSIRFVPVNGYITPTTGTPTLPNVTFRAWDKTEGTAGNYLTTSGKTGMDGTFSQFTATSTVRVADLTPPELVSAKVVGNQLTLTYSENRSGNNPDVTDFTVKITGTGEGAQPQTVSVTGSPWSSSATSPVLVLTLATPVQQFETVTVSYADTGTVNPIKDAAGLLAANLTDAPVTNNTRPPVTLTELTTLDVVATEDTQQEITFAQLAAKGNEAGYEVAFKVTNVNGTLKIGASAGTAEAYHWQNNAIINANNKAYWTPETNANGNTVTAFQVKAVDDVGNESSTGLPVQLQVNAVNDAPTITFASGPVLTDFDPNTWDESYRILDSGNGKFILAGTSGDDYYLTLARYNADGSLDTSYSSDGKSVIPIVIDSFQDATIDAQGNVYFTGKKDQSYDTKYVVLKVGSNGVWDDNFGVNGVATSFLPSNGTARGIALQQVGDELKIVTVARQGSPRDFFVERFNADGTKDTSFGDDDPSSNDSAVKLGYAKTDLGASEYAYEMVIQSDGKIILVGGREGTYSEIAIVRYNANGTLDTSFGGGDGIIIDGSSGGWSAYSAYYYNPVVALQSDGKIVIAADADGDGTLLARYTTTGEPDVSFAGGKVAIDSVLGIWNSYDIKIDASGNIFVLGRGEEDFAVAKLSSAGVLDDSFGDNNGVASISLPDYARPASLILTSTGKILITGENRSSDTGDGAFMVVRLNANGSQDATFGGGTSYELGSAPIALGSSVTIADVDVTDYTGFQITLARDGGGVAQDVFSASGNLEFGSNGVLLFNDSAIGSYANAAGTLTLNLGDQAYGSIDSNTLASIVAGIGYENTSTSVPNSPTVNLKWTVKDGNAATNGTQGSGSEATVTAIQTINLTPDATAPTIVSSTPVDNDSNAVATGNIVLNFSENITAVASKNIVIHKAFDDSVLETIAANNTAKVGIVGTTVTVNPTTNLDYSTGYYIKIDSGAFKDSANNTFAGIADTTNLNFTTAPKSPLYQSATVSGSTLTLTYDDALDATNIPAGSDFAIQVNGVVAALSNSNPVAVDSTAKTVTLTLAAPIVFGDKVTFSYTDPNPSSDDANAIQGSTGVDAASLTNFGAVNTMVATGQSTVTLPTILGDARTTDPSDFRMASISVGGGYTIANAVNSAAPTTLGKNIKMPVGQFAFDIAVGVDSANPPVGRIAQMSMTVDADLKLLTYYKWNYVTSKWTNIAKSVEITKGVDGIAGNADDKAIIRFELTDGGAYDSDRTVDGVIKDPGGVAENKLLPVILEKATEVGDVTALNTESVSGTLSYAITGGADAAKFSISSAGALSFLSAPDFELPTDAGDNPDNVSNNTYAVTVTVSGSNGGSEVQPLIVTVMNVPEAGDPTVDSNVTAQEATMTVTAPPAPPSEPTPTPTPTPTPIIVTNPDGTATVTAPPPGSTVTTTSSSMTTVVSPGPTVTLNNTGTGVVSATGLVGDTTITASGTGTVQVDITGLQPGNVLVIDNTGTGTVELGNLPDGVVVRLLGSGPVILNDNDGATANIENTAPAISGGAVGDGNGDGTPDALQSNVASIPFLNSMTAVSNPENSAPVFISLVADSKAGMIDTSDTTTATLSNVKQLDAPADVPANVAMPLGLISFESKINVAGGTETFSLYVDSSLGVNAYLKQNAAGSWVNLASSEFGGTVVNEGGKTRLDFALVDGGEFDADGKADGVITDPGAPGVWAADADTDRDQFPDNLEAANGLTVGIKDNDVFTSSKFFVMQMYRDTLFREAEPGGLANWMDAIDSGRLTRPQVASHFLDSAEFQAGAGAIARLYTSLLQRIPDAEGMQSWMDANQAGIPLSAISAGFVASPELAGKVVGLDNSAFVEFAYQTILNRAPEAAGKAYWQSLLANGGSRGEVVLGMTESPENKAATDTKISIALDYIGLLGRTPEQSGYDNWLAESAHGMTEITVIGHFMAAPEYHDRFLP